MRGPAFVLFQFQYGAIGGRSTTQKNIFIFNRLTFSNIGFFGEKIVDPPEGIFTGGSTSIYKSLIFSMSKNVAFFIFFLFYGRKPTQESHRQLFLQKSVEVLALMANNFFIQPFLLAGFKDN